MQFSLGKPILVLLIVAVACGVATPWRAKTSRPDLLVWVFSDNHARIYRQPPDDDPIHGLSLIEQFHRDTGTSVRVDLIATRAEDMRLVSMFMSNATDNRLPDLVEIEIGSVGKYFRPPVDEVGFLPLNDYLEKSGYADRILANRFAPWSKTDPRTDKQIIFGIPNDVHPMGLTYRKDLFDAVGIDLEKATTWPEFQQLCLQFQKYQSAHGRPDSRAIELFQASPEILVAMLLQRGINLVDSANQLHFTDPKVAQTVAFYAQMRVGPNAIGADTNPNAGFYARNLANADVCALWTPDWRTVYVERYVPELSGKVRLMPLPKFDQDDVPTSTWGGTMLGIPRNCPDPDRAWKLLEYLYLSPQGNAARLRAGNITLPPVPELWSDPMYHVPDPFYGGQSIGEEFVNLARLVPKRFATPFTVEAQLYLIWVLQHAQDYVLQKGTDGLEQSCAGWLADAQQQMEKRIAFGEFQQ